MVVDAISDTVALKDVAAIFHLVDDISEAPDALAYHTVEATSMRPVLRLGVRICMAGGGLPLLTSAMSHEAVETKCNPYVNRWVDMNDGVTEVCHEACDPVEGDSYEIEGITVSNFVGPRWFSDGPGPYDFLGRVLAPFTMTPHGYMVLRTGGPAGTQKQVFGDHVPEKKRAAVTKHGRVVSAARIVAASKIVLT
jgi:hypothetical protein